MNNDNLIHNNFKIYNGSWGSPAISDLELRNLYSSSKLTIIPLKNSLQPSGQSVALQSIACGTPVLISKTDGFWDNKNFKNGSNIFFNKDNDLKPGKKKYQDLYKMDSSSYEQVIRSGLDLIHNNYDLNDFCIEIENILFS